MSYRSQASFPQKDEAFITSWSGGKDASFALWTAQAEGGKPAALCTMLGEDGEHTGSHGLHRDIIQAQANALNLPVIFKVVPQGGYETSLKAAIQDAQQELQASSIVFGDIDLDAHRVWLDRVACEVDSHPCFPLWHYSRRQLLDDVISAGFQMMIISVRHDQMSPEYLGQMMTAELAREIESSGICPTGEDGEFHTLVTDGPNFSAPLSVETGSVWQDARSHSLLSISLK